MPGRGQHFRGPKTERIRSAITGFDEPLQEIEEWTHTFINQPGNNFYKSTLMRSSSDHTSPTTDFSEIQRAYVFFKAPLALPPRASYIFYIPFVWTAFATFNVTTPNTNNTVYIKQYVRFQYIYSMGVLTPQTLTWANQGGLTLGPSLALKEIPPDGSGTDGLLIDFNLLGPGNNFADTGCVSTQCNGFFAINEAIASPDSFLGLVIHIPRNITLGGPSPDLTFYNTEAQFRPAALVGIPRNMGIVIPRASIPFV
jgi:hypothetical protein